MVRPVLLGLAMLSALGWPLTLRAAEPAFVEATSAVGLSFVHQPLDSTPAYRMHGGGSVGDFNADGWPDLFVTGGGATADRLFINQQDGTFVDQAFAWGLTDVHRSNGASAADFNGDGWLDLYVTALGDGDSVPANGAHKLYRNNGNSTFTNVAEQAGVAWNSLIADGFGATWGDYDLDGDLDLWVGGWVAVGQSNLSAGTRLFRNNGDGTFRHVSDAAGVFDRSTRGFGAVFADMDGDRYPELLVAGDFGSSRYYANDRDGTFTRLDPEVLGGSRVYAGMGTAIGDFDSDGRFDWFVTAIYRGPRESDGNRLYLNRSPAVGQHQLEALPETAGVNDGGWGWGATAFDFDHDGRLDLLHTNGWWLPECSYPEEGCYNDEPSYLFRNQGDGTFTEVAAEYGLDHRLQGRGLVHFDPDRDGDMDVAIFANGDQLTYFRNELAGEAAHWLKVKLDTSLVPELAPEGIGSVVRVRVGSQVQHHSMVLGSNFLSRSELVAHFGLGSAAVIDELIIDWPSGFRTRLQQVATDQELTLTAQPPLEVGKLVRSESVMLEVNGMQPGEEARFYASAVGPGKGPCLSELGGLCSDLLSAVEIGRATAAPDGRAALEVTLPAQLAAGSLAHQVLVARGDGGLESYKSNVTSGLVLDPLQAR